MSTAASNPFDGLTTASFRHLGWEALLLECPSKECAVYQDRFRDMAKGFENAGQADAARAARALQWLAALQMRLDNPRQPFQGFRPMPGFELPGPEDFGEPLLAAFAELAGLATDPEFKARLADVCWCTQKKRDFALVATAIEGYLESSKNLRTPVLGEDRLGACRRWDEATRRLTRALQLARMTNHSLLGNVKAAFVERQLFFPTDDN